MADKATTPKLRGHNYKALKEAFVSGHSGGTVTEVNLVTLVAPSAIFLWSVLQSRYRLFSPYTPSACLTEFLLNCGAILSAITIYSAQPILLNALLLVPAIFILLTTPPAPRPTRTKPPQIASSKSNDAKPTSAANSLPFKPFVTMYRGGMMIITCAAILAVDFRLFPRRFAKVENWGTSVMDMGVGSFVFAAGLASARGILKEQLSGRRRSLIARLGQSVKHSLPLLVLGIIRLLSVKGVDYAEHVTEYGVHWNFFFTLAFLPPFMALFDGLFALVPSYEFMAVALGLAYEAGLDFTNLTAFIITAPRDNFFSQNREGIFSFLGYLAIFLGGQGAGSYVLARDPKPPAPGKDDTRIKKLVQLRNTTLGRLFVWTAIWTGLFALSTSYFGLNLRVSRRLANLPYILWVCAFNCSQLFLLRLTEMLTFPDLYTAKDAETEMRRAKEATSGVMRAFNRNGLAVFLLANLLTGAVNLSLPTLNMRTLEAMAVLSAYMGVLTGVALALDKWDISIKL